MTLVVTCGVCGDSSQGVLELERERETNPEEVGVCTGIKKRNFTFYSS